MPIWEERWQVRSGQRPQNTSLERTDNISELQTIHGRDQVFLTSEPRTRLFSSHKCVRNQDSTKSCFPGRDRDRVRDLSPLLGETGTSPGPGPLHRYYPGPSLNSPGPRIFNRCDLKCSRFFNDGLTINVQNKINKLIQYLLKSFTGSHSNKIDQSRFAYGASGFWWWTVWCGICSQCQSEIEQKTQNLTSNNFWHTHRRLLSGEGRRSWLDEEKIFPGISRWAACRESWPQWQRGLVSRWLLSSSLSQFLKTQGWELLLSSPPPEFWSAEAELDAIMSWRQLHLNSENN